MGDFANYWQAFVPYPLRFGYDFVSVYYHLKEHYVNFSRFFKGLLNYACFESFFVEIEEGEVQTLVNNWWNHLYIIYIIAILFSNFFEIYIIYKYV